MINNLNKDILTIPKKSTFFITVVILNWLRPINLVKKIIPILIKCNLINEIIISHGRKDTYFDIKSNDKVNIINRKDFLNNKKFGLSLRFISAIEAKNENILFIDDDQVPSIKTIENIFYLYLKNYPGIVGKYGRNLGFNIRNLNKHKSIDTLSYLPYNIDDGRCHILLTSFLFVPKSLCFDFLKEKVKLEKFVIKNSKPLWNGEDIFLSLLSILKFNKLPFVANNENLFPIKQLLTTYDLNVAISNKKSHFNYRTKLVREIFSIYKIGLSLIYHTNTHLCN